MPTQIDPELAAEIRAHETDLLSALLSDAEQPETTEIILVRKGQRIGAFTIRGLHEQEVNDCKEQATLYRKSPQLGIRVPESLDSTRYRNLLIYTATVASDRARLWDNKDAQRRAGVRNELELIDKLLLAGEKDAVIKKLDEMCGFGDLADAAGN